MPSVFESPSLSRSNISKLLRSHSSAGSSVLPIYQFFCTSPRHFFNVRTTKETLQLVRNENSFREIKQNLFSHFQFLKVISISFRLWSPGLRPISDLAFSGIHMECDLLLLINDFMACPHVTTKTIVYEASKQKVLLAVNLFMLSPSSFLHLFSDDSRHEVKTLQRFFPFLFLTLSRWEISDEIKSRNKTSSSDDQRLSWLKSPSIDREIGLIPKYFGNENWTFLNLNVWVWSMNVARCRRYLCWVVGDRLIRAIYTRMWHVAKD